MADNTPLNPGTGGDTIVTLEATFSGDTAKLQGVGLFGISGSEGSWTLGAIGGDATNGLDVDVTRLPASYLEDAAHVDGDRGLFMLGVRRDADTSPVGADGDYHGFCFNQYGRLKVSVQAAATSATTGNITSSSTTIGPVDVERNSGAIIVITGTHAGINFTFEASVDGTTWVTVQAVRIDTGAIETATGVITSNATRAWEASLNGFASFRVRSTAFTSGSGAITIKPQILSGENIVALNSVPTHAVTGSGSFTVAGAAAIDAAISGNPVVAAGRASTATPTAMSADGDVQAIWLTRNGAVVIDGSIVDDAAFTPATSRVTAVGYTADETATDSVDEGDLGAARMTLDRKQITTPYVHAAAGGGTPFRNIDVDETEDDVKASAGKLFSIHVMNLANAKRYLKIYDSTAASVTVGTTVPVLEFPIPTMADTNGAGFVMHFGPFGVQFANGICIAATTGLGHTDTGAPGANEVVVNGVYA